MGILDLFREWQENQSGKRRARRRIGLARIEILEVRRVLSPVVLSGTTLNVNAATNDPILIANNSSGVTIGVDGGTYNYASGITAINLVGSSGNDQITLSGSFSSIAVSIKGGGGNDTLIGPNTANTWNITSGNAGSLNGQVTFSGIDNLQGGTVSDAFDFAGGFISGNIAGGGVSSTLSYAAANTGVLVNLATGQTTALGGTFSGINNVVGCSTRGDTLIGFNVSETWSIKGINSGSVGALVTYSNFNMLQGGTGNNSFVFYTGGSELSINGGSGNNTFDYSNTTSTVSVDLAQGLATGVTGTFTNVTNVIGGQGSSTLTGPNTVNSWDITGPSSGSLNGQYTFTNITNLQGGRLANTFSFLGGYIRGNITGGYSTNTLDYSLSTSGLLIDLSTGQTTAVGGIVQNITNVVGNGKGNTLIGMNATNVWMISGANSGSFVDTPQSVIPTTITVDFSNIANITGGTGMNTFQMETGGSISGIVNGGTPVGGKLAPDWLDYSNSNTSVVVNLGTNSATNIGTVLNVVGVHGSLTGVNTLTGNSNGNVLVGGGANDTLTAGNGKSLLIGGLGSDIVRGSSAQSILIAGYTSYDENFAALSSILAEWQSSDSFATRVSDIRNGGGLNGANVLVANQTVFNDSATNSLYDGPVLQNWLWGRPTELMNSNSTDVVDSPILGPVILSGAIPAIYTVNQSPVAVSSTIVLTDAESATVTSATIQITSGLQSSQDVLNFTPSAATGNITSSYSAAAGLLTLTSLGSTATVAQFQAALREVTYSNTAVNPTTTPRSLLFRVYDGTAYSNTVVNSLSIDFAPVLAGTSTVAFAPGGVPIAINPNIAVTDASNTTLASATVTISPASYLSSEDVLAFTGNAVTGLIHGTFNSATGVLTLQSSGAPATVAQYQAALRLVTYQDTNSSDPVTLPRTIGFQVSDGTALSNVINSTVKIAYGPELSGTSSVVFTPGGPAVTVNSNITASDATSSTLAYAIVSISSSSSSAQAAEDLLSFKGNASTGLIVATYNSATSTLTLKSSGAPATLAQYQAALRLVTYDDTNAATTLTQPRTITFQISDGSALSNVQTSVVTFP